MTSRFSPLRFTLAASCLVLCSILLTSCADDDAAKAVATFQQASTTLEQAYQALVNNANQVEENNYIDEQAFESKPITPAGIQAAAIMSWQQLFALRKHLDDQQRALVAAQINADDLIFKQNSSLIQLATQQLNQQIAAQNQIDSVIKTVSQISASVDQILKMIP